MRTAYKVLAYLEAAGAAVQAMVMVWADSSRRPARYGSRPSWAGYAVRWAAWLALPGYVLLLATRVCTRPPSPTRATALTSGARS